MSRMHVVVEGRTLELDPARLVGQGGEAEIFDVGGGRAVKLYKHPDHPDLAGQPLEQEAAAWRLAELEAKLYDFPRGLPPRVVAPLALAICPRTRAARGYVMRLVKGAEVLARYAQPAYRRRVGGEQVVAVFRDLHATLGALHRHGVVVGDLNDLNVLVPADAATAEAHLVDADSFHLPGHPCRVYTERFCDPLLRVGAAAPAGAPLAYTPATDWYAYAAMLLEALLAVGPYGGVWKKPPGSEPATDALRVARRITLFHPEVRYPKPALPLETLPPEVTDHLEAVFARDRRGELPRELLDALRWRRCAGCGAEHARRRCPFCAQGAGLVREAVLVRGQVTARVRLALRPPAALLAVGAAGGGLGWLYHERSAYRREDGAIVLKGPLDPRLTVRVAPGRTLLARPTLGDNAALLWRFAHGAPGHGRGAAPGRAGPKAERLTIDACEGVPTCDVTSAADYAVQRGRLWRLAPLVAGTSLRAQLDAAPLCLGEVLPGRTRIWAGPRFGLGFSRAGGLQLAFVFRPERPGLLDVRGLPRVAGQIVDAACVFAGERAFLLVAHAHRGRSERLCAVVRADGGVEAVAEGTAGDGTWLGALPPAWGGGAGPLLAVAAPGGEQLFAAGAEGLVRVQVETRAGRPALVCTRSFPDTAPWVGAGTQLLAGPNGLVAYDALGLTELVIPG